jgi:hypothetical protein
MTETEMLEENIQDVLEAEGTLSTNELLTRFVRGRQEFFKTLKGMEKRHIVSRTGGVDKAGTLGFMWTLENAD